MPHLADEYSRTWTCDVPACTSSTTFTRLADFQCHQSAVHGIVTPGFPRTRPPLNRVSNKGVGHRRSYLRDPVDVHQSSRLRERESAGNRPLEFRGGSGYRTDASSAAMLPPTRSPGLGNSVSPSMGAPMRDTYTTSTPGMHRHPHALSPRYPEDGVRNETLVQGASPKDPVDSSSQANAAYAHGYGESRLVRKRARLCSLSDSESDERCKKTRTGVSTLGSSSESESAAEDVPRGKSAWGAGRDIVDVLLGQWAVLESC
jgi:hypothetical protein